MKRINFCKLLPAITLLSLMITNTAFGQEQVQIDGAIIINTSQDPTPTEGTIRWTGKDFEGFNGVHWVSLTGNKTIGSVTDIDGNTYKTIRIGDQEWMTENLKVENLNSPSLFIPKITTGWESFLFPARGSYNNDDSLVDTYGYLYNWYAVGTGKLCPAGWHVPSFEEWSTLVDHLGGNPIANEKMKETGFAHWAPPNADATNESGFTGLPGGFRTSTGYTAILVQGFWWTSTESSSFPSEAFGRTLFVGTLNGVPATSFKTFGMSVRCLKD